jgi:hypothetical protein
LEWQRSEAGIQNTTPTMSEMTRRRVLLFRRSRFNDEGITININVFITKSGY